MISFVILISAFVIFSSPTIAQNKDLTINANDVSYEKDKSRVVAQGSVEVVYKDVIVYGNDIVYLTQSEEVHAKDGFVLTYEGISIEGDSLVFEIKDKKGQAKDISFIYRGIYLGGQSIDLEPDKFVLKNATFSTCDLEDKHYRVTAAEINFYPKYGWLVAYWGYFWLGPVPVVPMPTYIYDMMAEEKARKNLAPFPEFGSNDEDGWYVNERLAWHVRRELSGSYSISYAEKKGLGLGVEADYIVNDSSNGNARVYGNAYDGMWGGLTHRFLFGEEIEEADSQFGLFFALPRYHQYELETTISHRERVNYQRVSLNPDVALKTRQGKLFWPEASYDAQLKLGMIDEEDNIRLGRGAAEFNFYWDFPEVDIGDITPSIGVDASFYSNGTKWIKSTGGLNLRKAFSENLIFGLGYLHYFLVKDQSPFLFEMYRFDKSDRLTSDLFFVVGETGVGIAASYFADRWDPEDIDYSLFFKGHCYNLVVTYRSLRREFQLGFGLSGG